MFGIMEIFQIVQSEVMLRPELKPARSIYRKRLNCMRRNSIWFIYRTISPSTPIFRTPLCSRSISTRECIKSTTVTVT